MNCIQSLQLPRGLCNPLKLPQEGGGAVSSPRSQCAASATTTEEKGQDGEHRAREGAGRNQLSQVSPVNLALLRIMERLPKSQAASQWPQGKTKKLAPPEC